MRGRDLLRVLLAVGLAAASLPARADCRSDIAALKPRLDAGDQKAANIIEAQKELIKAAKNVEDELACDNAVARAWRSYRTPPPEPAAEAGK